jgi:pilus assembly protein CpaC
MTKGTDMIRTALLLAALIAFGLAATGRAPAADAQPPVIRLVGSDASSRFVPLGLGKSVVIDLPRDVKDVLVADPLTANAVIRSARRAYIIGVKVGQTNVFFFDAEGQQIGGLDIAVTRNLNGLRAAIKQAVPNADIQVEGLGEGVVLTGNAATPLEAQTAFDIASRLVDDGKKVVNSITVHGRDQIMLKVTVAEMQRDVIKQLGVNLNGSLGFGHSVLNFNTDNTFSASGQPLNTSAASSGTMGGPNPNPNPSSFRDGNGLFRNTLQATLRAMERNGVVRTLAEPTLTAISGESANFLVGGEFPIITGSNCTTPTSCTATVEYKPFGVALTFIPVVLSGGRISIRVKTEVSELSTEGSVISQGVSIPGIKTRRAETTLELPSGGSLAMAGMIQEQTKQNIDGIPTLMQVPILGTLFKSRDFVNRQSELAVIVTPYVVRATSLKELSRPDDGFADASDPSTVLLGRLNRIYGVARKPDPKVTYTGNYGFILD